MAWTAGATGRSHQTVRLGVGKHDGPGDVVCLMELASMLAGERFGDRPASVCPIVGAILRGYNDNLPDELRKELYRYAAEVVDTRGSFALQLARARVAIHWGPYTPRSAEAAHSLDGQAPRGSRRRLGSRRDR